VKPTLSRKACVSDLSFRWPKSMVLVPVRLLLLG
jgi:hypothetical protein